MTPAAKTSTVAVVPATDRIQVILEVEAESDPIAGLAVGADGTSRAFLGWTALADAIAAALDADTDGRRSPPGESPLGLASEVP